MEEYREETDTLGPVKIPATALWGPQTERSRHNFPHGDVMPVQVIRALLQIKQAAARVNQQVGTLTAAKATVIEQAAKQLLALDDAELMADFPLHVYQTGSGTQTNMNVNEVLAHVAAQLDPATPVTPNDDINQSQSSNDTFPTAMNIAATLALVPVVTQLQALITALTAKQLQYWHTVKIGRTHLQDATPLTFGQEISGWVSMLTHDLGYVNQLKAALLALPIGGTAVGTGLNTPPAFAAKMTANLAVTYQVAFRPADNNFAGLAAHSELTVVHGALRTLAADLVKIGNDLRFLASGPRAGYGELSIPANEPGSSIMPGKVNPTQIEALTMAAARVMGNDTTITFAASQGNFEMNVYKPVIIAAFLESAELLSGTIEGLTTKLVAGLTVNAERMQALVDESLMTVTALSPKIGYHHAAEIAQLAERAGSTLREAALKSGYVTGPDFDQWVDPLKMTNIDRSK
ncbi:class II fumarate hydratase [Lactobacillus sp. CBA3605]|uniref:class II fumarate hydratase n=1 Tax=Lactobacillus sp. CBA3605 TaxID=2099788 RepID=UPI000CFDEB7A|nr:class II fumarate hydratase [Lactobacillus sp. CBA3605]AVK60961.1 class II fumarate hydratase [Lactobacillus sp. CBA3605]